MITLATLPNATAQEVFNQVCDHLLTQNEKSMESRNSFTHSGDCAYRGDYGKSCAAGILISDSEMEQIFEKDYNVGHSWFSLINEDIAPRDHSDLIRELQNIHDEKEPEDWAAALKNLAENRELEPTNLLIKTLRFKVLDELLNEPKHEL